LILDSYYTPGIGEDSLPPMMIIVLK